MRTLISLGCLATVSAVLAGVAAGADPDVGTLSVERGKGIVTIEVRGSVLGRLANGAITVTDRTPGDPYLANITGRRIVVQRKLGPSKVYIRGQGLRFRMVGGSFRIVIRGSGISVSAVGRGNVTLDGEPRFLDDDVGVYSVDGTDCSIEPLSCVPVPDEPIRLKLGKATDEGSRSGSSAR